ncbi:HAD-IB family hydrolase [Streptomyces ziwulingensis]|uniref:HAD-IB family hydrolase n=1 Tax=Streptomyces ziwulingensis TaxID=1045501 RepID=A0ABP9AUA4_9ACTN
MYQKRLRDPAPARPAIPRRLAFFDVDETLISGKSMIDFLRHAPDGLWPSPRAHTGAPAGWTRGRAGVEELAELDRRGAGRAEMNRAYYRLYAGVSLTALRAAGRAWYTDFASRPAPYVTAGVEALAGHRRAGHTVVLVSGSAHPFVDPVAEALGVGRVLCTELEVDDDGLLTGGVTRTMIGADKGRAVTELRERLGVAAEDCFAYGDHASDLAMLQAVGNAAVVGEDPVLLHHARQGGWPVLSDSFGDGRRMVRPVAGDRREEHVGVAASGGNPPA